MTSREAQIEKHSFKHTPSNPAKHVEYPDVEGLIGLQVSDTSQSYSAGKRGIRFTNRTGWNWKPGVIKTWKPASFSHVKESEQVSAFNKKKKHREKKKSI